MSGKAVSVTEINTDEISTEYNTYDSDGKLQKSENSDGEDATQRTVPCVNFIRSPLCYIGVGNVKLKQYGEQFLEVIGKYKP